MPPGGREEMPPRVLKTGLCQSEAQPLREDGRGHREGTGESRLLRPERAPLAGEKGPGKVGGGPVPREAAPRAAEGERPRQAAAGQLPAQAPAFPQQSVCSCCIRVSAGSAGSPGSWKATLGGLGVPGSPAGLTLLPQQLGL